MLGEHRKVVLPNGLRILGVENAALHSFVISVYIRVGPRFESSTQTGLTHFAEHMLMQGSQNYPTSSSIMRGVEDLGGVVDAATYSEYVNVVFGVHRKHWPRVMDIASDVIIRPLFDRQEIEQEKLIIAQELSQQRDKEGRNISVSELAYCLLFKDRVDEAGTRGSHELLQQFDRQALLSHYRKFFVPANMVVCLAGGFDFDEVIGRMDEYFSAMEPGQARPEPPPPPAPVRGRARALYRTTEALPVADVLLSRRAYALDDDRFDASRAVSHLLGGGLSSRLFSRVREELGLVYEIESHLQGYSDTGSLDVFLSVSVDSMVQAVEAALDVVREVGQEGFSEQELERYKEGARCGGDMLCDHASHLAEWFGKQELLLGPDGVITPQQYVQKQEALTLNDLDAVMQDVLVSSPGNLVVVGPYGSEQQDALCRLFPAEQVETLAAPHGA